MAAIIALSSCGGGQSSNPLPPAMAMASAAGVYTGTTSLAESLDSIILPDGKYYGLYSNSNPNTYGIYNLITGTGQSNNGTYSATLTWFSDTSLAGAGAIDATYQPSPNLRGSIALSKNGFGFSRTFTASALTAPQLNFNSPAALSSIANTWTGYFFNGLSGSMTISNTGVITGQERVGCSFSGTVLPDASNNYYRVSLTFSGSPCELPNGTASGVAVSFLQPDGITRRFIMAVHTGNYGLGFSATR